MACSLPSCELSKKLYGLQIGVLSVKIFVSIHLTTSVLRRFAEINIEEVALQLSPQIRYRSSCSKSVTAV
jgi:hypothetical protein